tara:strand:- start:1189 stop:1416 length:228 start_codon:yes stop_codon:yes gene_type:complete
MKKFLNYEYMITPGVLKILSYIGMLVVIIMGILAISMEPITGISMIVLGPIAIRIQAELLLVIFEIHNELKKLTP